MGIMLKPFGLILEGHDEDDMLASNIIASFSARFYGVTPNQLWF
jgi:hypothetical protein